MCFSHVPRRKKDRARKTTAARLPFSLIIVGMIRMTAYFDGATLRSNPGHMGIGAWIMDDATGERIAEVSRVDRYGTCNEAEWLALLAALDLAVKAGAETLTVRGDSQLVINQVQRKWKVKAGHLIEYLFRADRLLEKIGRARVQFEWVPRENNCEADELSTRCFAVGGVKQ